MRASQPAHTHAGKQFTQVENKPAHEGRKPHKWEEKRTHVERDVVPKVRKVDSYVRTVTLYQSGKKTFSLDPFQRAAGYR